MNFARMNSTISGGDDDNKYRHYGIDMGQYGNEGMDWMEPQRRIYAEGEISMGCIDLDGTTVGLKGGSFLGKFSNNVFTTPIEIATKNEFEKFSKSIISKRVILLMGQIVLWIE